jgi:acyl carrier protein
MSGSFGQDMTGRRETIKEVFSTILQCTPDEIHDKTTPETLERWDSFQHLVLVAGFEEEFGIEIEPEEIDRMFRNFGVFREIIESKLAAKFLEA